MTLGLRQVASEMDLVHEKTSFSPVISEGFDRSNGIYDRTTDEVVAQGELGLPIFVGSCSSGAYEVDFFESFATEAGWRIR